ncbi:hypothetical protein [Rhodococcus sp. MEB032]|uniref:hypothetical protein n=1 Tax=Rhodococcus sp. MEB032 TaxID=3040322 RepID=UPI00254FD10E|nr:hypothetical protein [Rhodococcus sp. MEB032]
MDLWPLITDDLTEGSLSIERQLRPTVVARVIDADSIADATDAIATACTDWAGGASPIVAVRRDSPDIDDRLHRLLIESNIDGIDWREIVPDSAVDWFSDQYAQATRSLLRQLIELEKPGSVRVQTARGLPTDDPWYIAYLGTLGILPEGPDRHRNNRSNLKTDLKFEDVIHLEGVDSGSIRDLVERISDPVRTTAVALTRERLPSGLVAGFNKGMPSNSRFSWGGNPMREHYGPNIIVVYEPGSIADLALLWNLRARFAHPPKLPLAVPITSRTLGDLVHLEHEHKIHHHFGISHHITLTSFSVPMAKLRTLAEATTFDVVDPWELMGPIFGYCVSSTDVAQFRGGEAMIASFSPTDVEQLGQQYLGSSDATWLRSTTTISNHRLPPSPTMRRGKYGTQGYLHGQIASVGNLHDFRRISQPTGLEVLRALAADRSLTARPSEPGVAGEHLIRASGGDLSMLASPGAIDLMSNLTRRGHSSLVKRRLDQFLAGTSELENVDKYDTLTAKLDAAIGSPELDETTYMDFSRIKTLLRLPKNETSSWIDWALSHRFIVRGIEATCPSCNHDQWRTLEDAIPVLICHGCGRPIANPFNAIKIDHQYRASETLLRANRSDALPAVLAMHHLSRIFDRRSGHLFGIYPGVELFELGSKNPLAEVDLLVILSNGAWVLGECKARARGLYLRDLEKLWRVADRVGAPATFAVTTEQSAACAAPWKVTEDPNGRPHFALTAEHLYDLHGTGPSYGHEFFEWRDSYPQLPADADAENWINKRFGEQVLRQTEDTSKWRRSPWDHLYG